MLLTYQDPSRGLVILSGLQDYNGSYHFTWHDETDAFNAVFQSTYPDGHVATACDTAGFDAEGYFGPSLAIGFDMHCFVKFHPNSEPSYIDGVVEFRFSVNSTSIGNITRLSLVATIKNGDRPIDSDIAIVQDHNKGPFTTLWFNHSTSRLYTQYEVPIPNTQSSFYRFAGTHASNFTNTYIYHQLSDSVIAEELWDNGDSGFWISSNITIDTS
ncbi:MAG: hypothetical protein Q9224_007496 [Gallowayella concinna]